MFTILFYGGIVLALAVVWIEYKCAVSNKKFYKTSNALWWNRVYKWRYLVGFMFILLIMIEYPVSVDGEWYSVIGFPLMAAVFDSKGTDFVSAFTGIFLFIDTILWYFLIHIILYISKRIDNHKNNRGK